MGNHTASVNLSWKVLDFVQLGGPTLTYQVNHHIAHPRRPVRASGPSVCHSRHLAA